MEKVRGYMFDMQYLSNHTVWFQWISYRKQCTASPMTT